MEYIFYVSIFWIAFGIAGLFGFQVVVPNKFKGKLWARDYIRDRGLSLLMLGIPWLLFYLLSRNSNIATLTEIQILLACALPSIIFDIIKHKKYKRLLKEDKDGNTTH